MLVINSPFFSFLFSSTVDMHALHALLFYTSSSRNRRKREKGKNNIRLYLLIAVWLIGIVNACQLTALFYFALWNASIVFHSYQKKKIYFTIKSNHFYFEKFYHLINVERIQYVNIVFFLKVSVQKKRRRRKKQTHTARKKKFK